MFITCLATEAAARGNREQTTITLASLGVPRREVIARKHHLQTRGAVR